MPESRVPPFDPVDGAASIRRAWLWIGVALVATVIVLSLAPTTIELPGEQGDKFGHGLAYATLMGWFAQLYAARGERVRLAVGFVAMGVAIECVQGFLPTRQFSVADMGANSLGVLAGWLAAPPRVPGVLRRLELRLTRRRAGASPHDRNA